MKNKKADLALIIFLILMVLASMAMLVIQGNSRLEVIEERDELAINLQLTCNMLQQLATSLEDAEFNLTLLSDELAEMTERAEWYANRYEFAANEFEMIWHELNYLRAVLVIGYNNIVADLSDLRIPSNATEQQLNMLLENSPLRGYGWYFLAAERQYGVNAIFVISLMRQESALGRYQANRNNFAGITTGYPDPARRWQSFDTVKDGIFAVFRLLGIEYLCYYGRFHMGVSLDAVNRLYAPLSDPLNHGWAPGIRSITRESLNRLED